MKNKYPSLKNKQYYILFFGALFVLLSACKTAKNTVDKAGNERKLNVKYGPHKRNLVDFYLPANRDESTPFVLLIHGGAWTIGSKRMYKGMQKKLMKNGIASANMNYQLVGSGADFKDMLEDIQHVDNLIHAHEKDWNLPGKKYHIMGESAGAHLSLLFGNKHPEKIKTILSFSGPTNFSDTTKLNQSDGKYRMSLMEKLAGVPYVPGSGHLPEEYKEMSPIYQINDVKTLIFQGGKDNLVDPEDVKAYEQKLTQKNVPHEFIFKPKWGHLYRLWPKKKKEVYRVTIKWLKEEN